MFSLQEDDSMLDAMEVEALKEVGASTGLTGFGAAITSVSCTVLPLSRACCQVLLQTLSPSLLRWVGVSLVLSAAQS